MNKIYSRLAFTNIKNNKTLYMPYIISGMVMIAMFYVMMFLDNSKGLSKVPGADALASIMGLGCGTIAVFSYIFLFYTNSFIIKRRKKEVGIYNILGMEKRHIARVLIIETLTIALAAIVSGIIAGILFSKLMIMFLYRIINIKAQIDFAVSNGAVVNTILIFGVLYFLTLIYNLMQVKLANPIELLRGGNVGEKEPKSKWLIAIIGLGCLAGGYYIAITTKSPLQVLSLFFVAVLLVIVGTYLLFISGSIVILKALRKNKKFYYNKKHFAAVSGMIYRMKQNAGGLASICVLSTMVLVVVSTTVSMYAGMEGELKQRYPSDISVYSWYKHFEENSVKSDVSGFYEESRDANREQIYVLYGGLFFIGIFLGTMFLMVTVMIIFYKQISEGYDDKARYEIMEKVGMSNDEVKKSITSQVRMVFFLPIILAACHLAAAFPLLRRLLVMFNLTDVKLIVICMVATLLVFMVIYYIVFKITSRAYYRIVGNQI